MNPRVERNDFPRTKPPGMELVVARYREDLRWLKRVPASIRIAVYDKSGAASAGHCPLPNAGREAQTYLHHIAHRYDALAEWTVFAQGRPFDHAPDLHKRLRSWADGRETVGAFRWLGFLVDWDDARGGRLFQRWSKNPERRPLDMAGFARAMGDPAYGREPFVFFGGAQFAVSREVIRARTRPYYERALEVAGGYPDAAHCFERVWDRVFGQDGIPAGVRGRPLPVYLKTIKRLAAAV